MSLFDALTEREFAVASRLVIGQPSAAISEELHIASGTLDRYKNSIYRKLGIGGDDRTKRKRLADLFYARHQPEGPEEAPSPVTSDDPAPGNYMDALTLQEAYWHTWLALVEMEHRALRAEDICRSHGYIFPDQALGYKKPGQDRIPSAPLTSHTDKGEDK